MTLYAFKYCPCTYESAAEVISVHKTVFGAYRAMRQHRLNTFWEWREMPNEYRKSFQDTFAKHWFVHRIEVLE